MRERLLAILLILHAPLLARADLPAASAPPRSADALLRYEAFLAGTPIGEATVRVVVEDGRYRVSGDARAGGWLERLTRWRTSFLADGRVEQGSREPVEFSYVERDTDKLREVRVREGTLEEKKNGKLRAVRPAFPGPDLLSALFVEPRCGGDRALHTGRSSYQLTELAADGRSCRFAVVDDEDDHYEVDLQLARHRELLVPELIRVRGVVTGWLQLVDAAPVDR